MSRALPIAFAVAVLSHPSFALACSTCMDPREGNRTLLSVTIFLSLLPLALMGGIGGWLYRRHLAVERALLAASPPAPSTER